MKIIVDCMSGDHAPLEIVKGAIAGANAHDTDVLLVGDEHVIRKIIRENELSEQRVSIYHTPDDPVLMTDDPGCVVRDKKDASMGQPFVFLPKAREML